MAESIQVILTVIFVNNCDNLVQYLHFDCQLNADKTVMVKLDLRHCLAATHKQWKLDDHLLSLGGLDCVHGGSRKHPLGRSLKIDLLHSASQL